MSLATGKKTLPSPAMPVPSIQVDEPLLRTACTLGEGRSSYALDLVVASDSSGSSL